MQPTPSINTIQGQLCQAYKHGKVASIDGDEEFYLGMQLKRAAVLVPLVWWEETWHLVFTRRTETVEHHKGQVSFPGGGCDLGETTPEQTALRETEEEIGVKREDIQIMGRLNEVLTITQYRVAPVVGLLPWPYAVQMEPGEVAHVFTIPLKWLADPTNWDEKTVSLNGFNRPLPVITYHSYQGETLWGISARITHNLLKVINLI